MIDKNTLTLLRIPFSVFLMPVFLFAVSQVNGVDISAAILVFVILHLFIYPASNGYNSYMDKDETSIGGVENPPMPTRKLFYVSLALDIAGLLLSLLVNVKFFLCILLYILASRAYSYRGIRLKKYPLLGFLTVVVFQGGFTFYMVYTALELNPALPVYELSLLILFSSALIAGAYPITQIYQHDADRKSGDISISSVLGVKGTFLFSCGMFLIAGTLLWMYCMGSEQMILFLVFQFFLLPVIGYFIWWMWQSWQSMEKANFKNTMRMNLISSGCMNLCFITFIILKDYHIH